MRQSAPRMVPACAVRPDRRPAPPFPLSADTAVEYYHAGFGHYSSSLPRRIAALDNGAHAGRTGARSRRSAGRREISPACRFYISRRGTAIRLFSASPAECADILRADRQPDPNYSG